ncbi:hypothetical protein [Prevotella sp. 10(H)]|uniref:hypothetical protein n=1 Tax=Prevotella sp. 10(H) TaxID=1158294 RepID=UPI0004A76F94|nr:hypothetical protein [Prevotella sp. 10(H)]
MKTQIKIIFVCFAFNIYFINLIAQDQIPISFEPYVKSLTYGNISNIAPKQTIQFLNDRILHIKLEYNLTEDIQEDDYQINITPAFKPDFSWAPHLTPTDRHVIDQHVFRSPAMIVSDKKKVLTIIPDIGILKKGSQMRWYMDMDAPNNILTLGMSNSRVSDHVLYEKTPGARYNKGVVEFGFYIIISSDIKDIQNPFRTPLSFFWERWGHQLYESGNPVKGDLEPYVKHTYNWAFSTWKNSVWQQFSLNGKDVGAPVFIVNVTQSPNYPGKANEREFRSIWNQAWFNSLRSASGLYRYARRTKNQELLKKANMTKELALSFPMKEGFFYGLIAAEMEQKETDGKRYNICKGWDTYYWGNSNRNPYTHDPRKAPFHILDMSWTALQMLRWYEDLEKDERLLQYAETYAKSLIKTQDTKGFFPGWLDIETLQPMEHLNESPETSMSVTFLLKLAQLTGNKTYKNAAERGLKAVISEIIPTGRWEDFETYWSCCRIGTPDWIGKKVSRNNMYKQCNFSMFWTAEALLEFYKEAGNKSYLEYGKRTLDEMLMTQSSWQPPYIYVNALGGFGVMNTDGEWNDSRGSLFAELILEYAKITDTEEYKERGIAALKSSLTMMYCPENPVTKAQWEKVWPFFNEKDYGFTMENYGHGGHTAPEGEGMGEFTIYDWGNGAASEAYNRIIDKYGKDYLE